MTRNLLLALLALTSAFTLAWGLTEPTSSAESTASIRAQDFEALRVRAEQLRAEGSHALALRELQRAGDLDLGPEDRRWLEYAVIDSEWRSLAASKDPDASSLDQVRKRMLAWLDSKDRPEELDDLWAMGQESRGDSHWVVPRLRSQSMAFQAYRSALDYWAQSDDLETARERYLGIVFRMIEPADANHWAIRNHAGSVDEKILEGAARIARSPEERARANYYLALRGERYVSTERQHRRTRDAFETVLEIGPKTSVYSDALYAYGVWLEERGIMNVDSERGQWTSPDYVAALVVFERLMVEYKRGTHEHWNDARNRIKKITSEEVSLTVGRAFLPSSEIGFGIRWRNVKQVALSLHPVDLDRAVQFDGDVRTNGEYLQAIDLGRFPAIHQWTYATKDEGLHLWGQDNLRPPVDLLPGAYVLRARGGEASSREMILVSDAGLVVKTEPKRVTLWMADVRDGKPVASADVVLWSREEQATPWVRQSTKTDEDGLASFDIGGTSGRRHQYFIAARFESRQAFNMSWEPWGQSSSEQWKILASADRGAYRPGQEVSWKMTARVRDEMRYSTPGGAPLRWEIWNPRGEMQTSGNVTLNEFGSAWGSLVPEPTWNLGEYQVRFYQPASGDRERGTYYGAATLFRLEEYKLPEFQVQVEVAKDEEGQVKQYRPGDLAEMVVSAQYYFGGAVKNASVVIEVSRQPFYKRFDEPREFPWFYRDSQARGPWGWGAPARDVIMRDTLAIGEDGQLTVNFETEASGRQDYEYTVSAKVTDSSRREISGLGKLRVTHQSWFAHLKSEHQLHEPGSRASIELSTRDADDRPVQAKGDLSLLRLVWKESWMSPQGRRLEGLELRNLRSRSVVFPPAQKLGQLPWRPIVQGYEEELVQTVSLNTDELGKAKWTPTLTETGHYLLRFAATDEDGAAISAETSLECVDENTNHLALAPEAPRLLLDRDTFREGRPGNVMISTPVSGRWVLFSIENEASIEHRVVHLPGNVKLLTLDVTEAWIPNVQLSLSSFHQGRFHQDVQEVIVPPLEHFLQMELVLDPAELLPGEQGAYELQVRDSEGRPVKAQVDLALVDASVDAIQQPYAPDPREFFYGDKRVHGVRTHGVTPYVSLVENEKGQLIEAQFAWGGPSDGPSGPAGGSGPELEKLRSLGYLGDAAEGMAPRSVRAGIAGKKETSLALRQSGADDFALGSTMDAFRGPGGSVPARGEGEVVVQVRKDFRETALWIPDVTTDEAGRARGVFEYPESLTTWKARARGTTINADFGRVTGESATRLPLLVRLQAPRFFVEGDECVVSLNLDNRTDEPIEAKPSLSIEGLRVLGFLGDEGLREQAPETVTLPANGGMRLDWRVRAEEMGSARFVAKIVSAEHSDGIERSLPVVVHGIESWLVKSGRFDGSGVQVQLDLPAARREGSTRFEVQVTPSLAVTMLDALPFLVDYPYGCTEQTLSRFLPSVVVKDTLSSLGLDPEVAMERVYGGIEREFVDKTQRETGAGLADLDRATKAGLERLYDFQKGDGSWSWWKSGSGDPFMTAYVVWGLCLARDAGVEVDRGKLDAGGQWLGRELVGAKKNPSLQAWMLHAHSAWLENRSGEQREFALAACDNLLSRRVALNAYGRSLLALSAHELGRSEDAKTLLRNLIDGVQRDESPDASIIPIGGAPGGTQSPRAHWGEDGVGYRWSDGGVEATAFALRAIAKIHPGHELMEPVADWLVSNRRGAQWSNTKTTSIVVLCLNDYLLASGQLDRSIGYRVLVNDQLLAEAQLSGSQILSAPASYLVPDDVVRSGRNEVRIERTSGSGPLFFSANASFFSLEEPIPPRGNEVFLRRQYFKLAPRPTLLRGVKYERQLMASGDSITSGETVEVVLTIESKNHLEYLLFEDLKPAGFEATQVKSGSGIVARELRSDEVQHRLGDAEQARSGRGAKLVGERYDRGYTGRTRSLHQELRDRHVAFFLDQCPEGVWEIRYELRAESPGSFHALPVLGHAMYVPEIRANGAEIHVQVLDREDI